MTIKKNLLLSSSILTLILLGITLCSFFLVKRVKDDYQRFNKQIAPISIIINNYAFIQREFEITLPKGKKLNSTASYSGYNKARGYIDVDVPSLNIQLRSLLEMDSELNQEYEAINKIIQIGDHLVSKVNTYLINIKDLNSNRKSLSEFYSKNIMNELSALNFFVSHLKHDLRKKEAQYQNKLSEDLSMITYGSLFSGVFIAILIIIIIGKSLIKITKPIYQLEEITKQLSLGNFDVSIDIKGYDEFVELGSSVREMSKSLAGNFELLKTKNNAIEKVKKLELEKKLVEKSLQFRSEFLSNMSHEIRTPMNGIIGMVDVLKTTTNLDTDQKKIVRVINSSSNELLNLLNDILDLSKLEAGKVELVNENFEIEQILTQVSNLFSSLATNKGLTFHSSVKEDVPPALIGAKGKLIQVLSNLYGNAIKFTEQGSVKMIVSKVNLELYKIEIIDTGEGVSEENKTKLFQNFQQLDQSSSKKVKGTGLGLAICKNLIDLMGGEIGLESTPGEGSNFWFTFKAKADKKTSLSEVKLKKDIAKFDKRVLIVDDILVNLLTAELMLKHLGCTVDKVNSGRKAIEKCKTNQYDIILMDIQMPEMDGVETTNRIKELLGESPPVIALTANAMEGDRELFIEKGLDDYMAKPVKIDALKNLFIRIFQDHVQ